jgi:hypothetical protein
MALGNAGGGVYGEEHGTAAKIQSVVLKSLAGNLEKASGIGQQT